MQLKLILSFCLIAATQARAELTLSNAIVRALANNASLRAARPQIEIAAGRAQQTRAWPNPELEFSAEDMPADNLNLGRSQNMIGLSQTIPFPGKQSLASRQGRREVAAATADVAGHEGELTRQVTVAFYSALAAEQKLAVARELLELAESLQRATDKRVKAGDAGNPEALRAGIAVERARLEVTTLERDSAATHHRLTGLLGGPVETLRGEWRTSTNVVVTGQHPAVQAARARADAADLEWRKSRQAALPDVTVGVAGGRDEARNESLVEFRVSLPLPIFDRGQGRQRETRAQAAAARQTVVAVEQQWQQEFSTAQANVAAAATQVEAYRDRILPNAETAMKLVRDGFEAGKFAYLDLTDTQRTFAEARLAYLDQLLELNIAIADLEALAGTARKE